MWYTSSRYVPGAMPQINMFVGLLHSGWLISLTLIAFSDISLRTHTRVTYVDILITYVIICTSYVRHEHICAHLPCTQTVHHRAITCAHGLVLWQHANRPSYMTCITDTSHLSMPKGENASNDNSTTRFRGSAAKATSPSTYFFHAGEPMTPCYEHGWFVASWSHNSDTSTCPGCGCGQSMRSRRSLAANSGSANMC